MAKSGLIQTGDVILTFRPEWGGGGAYPNIQMGISHTSIAYIKDGAVHQLDIPLNAEYLGGNYARQFRQRALPDAEVPACHPAARPDGGAEEDDRRLGDAVQQRRAQGLSEPDQLQRRLQRAEVRVRQAARLRQASGQIGLGQNPAGPDEHVLLGVRLVAAGAAQLRSGEDRGRLQGRACSVLCHPRDVADARDGRLHHAAHAWGQCRACRGAAAGRRGAEAAGE